MTLRPVSIPIVWRTFLLVSALFACLTVSADYARGQAPPDDPPPSDQHGDSSATATLVPFGSSVEGRIDPATDTDFFTFDLRDQTGPTDVWIYTTGELDTLGYLLDNDVEVLFINDDSHIEGRGASFHVRAILDPDYYFVLVRSLDRQYVGDYTLHVEPVPDHGDTGDTATRMELSSPVAGRFDTRSEEHYFRLDVAEQSSLLISVRNPELYDADEELQPVSPIDFTLHDEEGEEVSVNVTYLSLGEPPPHGFLIRDDFAPGTYFFELSTYEETLGTLSPVFPVFYAINVIEDVAYREFIEDCEAQTQALEDPIVDDPLYACQWHLDQPNGEDVNVKPVWEQGLMGEGINIAVVDDGMDWTHEDLIDNVNADLNHDYTGEGDINQTYEHHGTAVSGVIAARDNDIGVSGVAPRATIYGYNLLNAPPAQTDSAEDAVLADAAARNAGVTAVSNNSWGAADSPALPPAIWELAVESAVKRGYDGKGVFYVFEGGNGHDEGDDSNLDGYANFYAVTAVCAVNEAGTRSGYSEMGANLWVCAPSSHPSGPENYRGIVTTENSNRYRDDFGGASSAAPAVSGVAALVRQANPDLTWRDVKLILAESARKNDPANPGWEDGARMYGLSTGSYHFNHEYGFGVVDAAAAVELAKSWTNLPPMRSAAARSGKVYELIPEPIDSASIETVALTLTLTLGTDIEFTEFIEINANFQHESFRDLDIELESPSGAVSKLTVPFNTFTDDDDRENDYVPMYGPYRFGSARHLGEDPNGVWTLRITDVYRLGIGFLESWSVKVYGHTEAPDENLPPTFADGETASRAVAENSPAGDSVGDPVVATDYDTLTYTLDGPDAALFDIDSASGQITVAAGASLDYETRNGYTVTVTATDPSGETATITVNVAVTDVSLGAIVDTYDVDRNERIDAAEAVQAVRDYFTGLIPLEDAVRVVTLYFST